MQYPIKKSDACFIIPVDLSNRIGPYSCKISIVNPIATLFRFSKIALGPYCGSDHLTALIIVNADPVTLTSKPSPIFEEARWPHQTKELEQPFFSRSFQELTMMFHIVTDTLLVKDHIHQQNCKSHLATHVLLEP